MQYEKSDYQPQQLSVMQTNTQITKLMEKTNNEILDETESDKDE